MTRTETIAVGEAILAITLWGISFIFIKIALREISAVNLIVLRYAMGALCVGLFAWRRGDMAVSLDQVRNNFARYGLLDESVEFLKGFFSETLPKAPIKRLAILRVDADLYGSTMDVLRNLYPALSAGGYAIFDDYQNLPDCRRAIDEFRGEHGVTEEIHRIDQRAVYWQKQS